MTAAARDRALFAIALAVGAGTWFGIAALSGQREAWDAPEFASLGLPFTYGACLVLGFFGSRQAWRWPILVVGAFLGCAVFVLGGEMNLWPLTLLLLALLAGSAMIPTYVGVGLRRLVNVRRARRLAAAARRRSFETAAGIEPEPPSGPRGVDTPRS